MATEVAQSGSSSNIPTKRQLPDFDSPFNQAETPKSIFRPADAKYLTDVSTALIVQRSASLTPTQHPMMKEIYDYNQQLGFALSSPIPLHFFYKSTTTGYKRFTYEEARRLHEWFGEELPDSIERVDPEPAIHEIQARDFGDKADEKLGYGDKGLNRLGEFSLYLLVKGKNGWRFPTGPAISDMALHNSAMATTHSLLGANISLWPAGRVPISHIPAPNASSPATFFFKARIAFGFPVLSAEAKNEGVTDFAFLTKEDCEKRIKDSGKDGKGYWESVGGLLNSH